MTTTIHSRIYTDGEGYNFHQLPVNTLIAQTSHIPVETLRLDLMLSALYNMQYTT